VATETVVVMTTEITKTARGPLPHKDNKVPLVTVLQPPVQQPLLPTANQRQLDRQERLTTVTLLAT